MTQQTKSRQQSGSLTSEEVERYKREGYHLHHRPVFPDSKFQALRDHFETKLSDWPKGERPESMDTPHFTDPKLFEWLFSDELLDLVEPILGPDIVLFSSHFICKPEGDGKRVPWHEDSYYWRNIIEQPAVVTVWLAIDPSTEENGCMKLIPRTHITGRQGFSDYSPVDTRKNVFATEILKEQRDDSKAVPCILKPNECSLHDARLMHGSDPNTSTKRRCGYTIRYMPSEVKLTEKAREFFQVYLARGKPNPDQNYADPSKSYPELLEARKENSKKVH